MSSASLRGRPEYNEILIGMGLEPYPSEPGKFTERKK